MFIWHPNSDTVCDFQKNEIGHYCLYPSISWVFPLNTEFRITFIESCVCTHSVPHDGHEGSYKQDLELREAGRVETVALIVKLQRLQTHRRTQFFTWGFF